MKGILVALSIGILGLGGALAQQEAEHEGRFRQYSAETDIYASELLGAQVFVSETEVVAVAVEAQPEDWEHVANVEDIVFSQEGELIGVLIDIGTYLGTEARQVVVSMDELRFVELAEAEMDDPERVFVVFMASREELEDAAQYEGRIDREAVVEEEPVAEEPVVEEEPVAEEPVAEEPVEEAEVERVPAEREDDRLGVGEPGEEFERVEWTALTVDTLQRAEVYDRFDQRVTGISDVLLSADGERVEAVLVDVGGFLGIGTHTVAVDLDRLDILYDAQTDDVRVYLDMTVEELEAMPEFRR